MRLYPEAPEWACFLKRPSAVSSRGANLSGAKRTVEDVAWLSAHDSYVQGGKRLGEVLWTVEQHLRDIETALKRLPLAGRRPSAAEILKIQKDHLRLLHLVQAAQAHVSQSEPTLCKVCLRRLGRSLELHEQRNHDLLAGASELADGEARRPQ
jgi:hypothetical protein